MRSAATPNCRSERTASKMMSRGKRWPAIRLVDETYVKIQGKWHYLYRGVDQNGQVLDCWLSRTRDLAAAEAFFRRTISSTGCTPEHVVTDKASFYPVGHPHVCTGRKAHGHRLLQPGDLD